MTKEIIIDGTSYLVDLEKAKSLGLIKSKPSLTPATLKTGQKYRHKWHDGVIYMGCTSSIRNLNCMIVLEGGIKNGDIVTPPGNPQGSAGFWDGFYEVND